MSVVSLSSTSVNFNRKQVSSPKKSAVWRHFQRRKNKKTNCRSGGFPREAKKNPQKISRNSQKTVGRAKKTEEQTNIPGEPPSKNTEKKNTQEHIVPWRVVRVMEGVLGGGGGRGRGGRKEEGEFQSRSQQHFGVPFDFPKSA